VTEPVHDRHVAGVPLLGHVWHRVQAEPVIEEIELFRAERQLPSEVLVPAVGVVDDGVEPIVAAGESDRDENEITVVGDEPVADVVGVERRVRQHRPNEIEDRESSSEDAREMFARCSRTSVVIGVPA
jgi:hypothetical protein